MGYKCIYVLDSLLGMYVTDISHPLNSARTRAPMQMGMSAGLLIGPALGGPLAFVANP